MVAMSTQQVYRVGSRVRVTQALPRPMGGMPATDRLPEPGPILAVAAGEL